MEAYIWMNSCLGPVCRVVCENGAGHKNFYGDNRIQRVIDYMKRKGFGVSFGYPPEYIPAVNDSLLDSI